MTLPSTPSQTIGPFFHRALERPAWRGLAAGDAAGERIEIEGRILDGDGQPVADAMLETWQADAEGRYGGAFRGFARIVTDAEGRFRLTTIRPGPVAGPGNARQAPHILVNLFARGLLRHLVTRIYFADRPEENAADPILGLIDDAGLRATLLAQPVDGRDGLARFRFDIVLQGAGETAFFDV